MCIRRTAYEQVGLYDPEFRFTMDFDWLARATAASLHGVCSADLRAEMAEGGRSNAGAFRRDLENFRVTRRYGTMALAPASLRLMLRLAMDAGRLGLEQIGADSASFAFRLWIDRRLGR